MGAIVEVFNLAGVSLRNYRQSGHNEETGKPLSASADVYDESTKERIGYLKDGGPDGYRFSPCTDLATPRWAGAVEEFNRSSWAVNGAGDKWSLTEALVATASALYPVVMNRGDGFALFADATPRDIAVLGNHGGALVLEEVLAEAPADLLSNVALRHVEGFGSLVFGVKSDGGVTPYVAWEASPPTFSHDITVRVDAESAEESLLRVEEIVRAIHESDALPKGVTVRSYTQGREVG